MPSLRVRHLVLVMPCLIDNLDENLVSELHVHEASLHNVIRQDLVPFRVVLIAIYASKNLNIGRTAVSKHGNRTILKARNANKLTILNMFRDSWTSVKLVLDKKGFVKGIKVLSQPSLSRIDDTFSDANDKKEAKTTAYFNVNLDEFVERERVDV